MRAMLVKVFEVVSFACISPFCAIWVCRSSNCKALQNYLSIVGSSDVNVRDQRFQVNESVRWPTASGCRIRRPVAHCALPPLPYPSRSPDTLHSTSRATHSKKTVNITAKWLKLQLRSGRTRVQISTRRPAILTELFRDCPQSLHANAGIAP
jgi:hypothetical protein